MKGIQNKINKLLLAFKMKEKIIKIDQKQLYSHKYDRIFTIYNFSETTKKELLLKKDLKLLKNDLKSIEDKKEKKEIKKKIEKIKNQLEGEKMPNIEFSKKRDLLLYMVDRYKELR